MILSSWSRFKFGEFVQQSMKFIVPEPRRSEFLLMLVKLCERNIKKYAIRLKFDLLFKMCKVSTPDQANVRCSRHHALTVELPPRPNSWIFTKCQSSIQTFHVLMDLARFVKGMSNN